MILLHLGHVPLQDHHHLELLRVYARTIPVLYLERRGDDDGPEARRIAWMHSFPKLPLAGLYRIPIGAVLPGERFGIVTRWNWWLGVRRVIRQLKSLGAVEVVLLTQTPGLLPTLRGLGADLTVYQVVDDYVGLAPDAVASRVARAHRRMAEQAQVAWAISRPLVEDLRRHRRQVMQTGQGIDWERFARTGGSPRPELLQLKSPRLGLVGILNDRIDWDTVHEVARRRADWQFVLVGPVRHAGPLTSAGIGNLRALPNVTFLPEIAPDDIPSYVASFDVGLLPYRLGRGTIGINPLKVYQYLAMGKPVVASPLPALESFGDLVIPATGAEETIRAIERALASAGSHTERVRRQERLRRFDWSEIAAQRLALIRGSLGGRLSAVGDGPCSPQSP